MYLYTLSIFLSLTLVVECQNVWDILDLVIGNSPLVPEDAQMDIKQLAFKYGYQLEEHAATTEDGYIINLHRIPRGKYNNGKGPVVLLMHGILECSDSWLLQGPDNALGYLLANEGYDVWMGNARGNKHSLGHTTLNHTMPQYWNFTWEQIGFYDLPAMINYILHTTHKPNLYYIGHSQGTTSGYVMLSMRPEYNQKVKMMFSLAPVAWMANIKSSIIKLFSPAFDILGPLTYDFNFLSSKADFFNKLSAVICSILPFSCNPILISMSGPGNKINTTLLPVILGHMPAGASSMQFVHFGQLINSNRFCRYDYGSEGNMVLYGQSSPPDYDLSKVVAPIILYYSGEDWLSHPTDVNMLRKRLPNVMAHIYLSDFTHLDYLYSDEATEVIYMRILSQIDKFEKVGEINNVPNQAPKLLSES